MFRGCAATLVLCCAAMPAIAANPALKRVVLSSGGVGYFEYEAPVEGDATVTLDVPLDQVDDVLKSLVIYDCGGTAGEVTLPGREPLAQSFADLPFDPAALNSAVDLLNALQGSEIRIVGPRSLGGRLVHVDQETVTGPGGVAETRSRVSVMTPAGLQQAVLQDVEAIAFADPELQRQVNAALTRIAAYRAVGPAAAQPAYARRRGAHAAARLCRRDAAVEGVVPAQPAGRSAGGNRPAAGLGGAGEFQRPALAGCRADPAFRQSGHVPPGALRKLLRAAADGTGRSRRPDTAAARHRHRSGRRLPPRLRARTTRRPAKQRALQAPGPQRAAEAMPMSASTRAAARPGADRRRRGFRTADADRLHRPYKITVAAGQSLMLPLLDRDLPARRIDLFQPSVNASHPLAAIEIANDSGSGLPPGVLTLYQQNRGRAAPSISAMRGSRRLPAGDKRLLSYALDGKVTIDRGTAERRPIVKASVADGVMRIGRVVRWTTTYRVKSAGSAAPVAV